MRNDICFIRGIFSDNRSFSRSNLFPFGRHQKNGGRKGAERDRPREERDRTYKMEKAKVESRLKEIISDSGYCDEKGFSETMSTRGEPEHTPARALLYNHCCKFLAA
ncbi:hypothetical protein [Candidatus Tokpelaia sp.]|uniref:hypothetical protein n=1 Tax=Candidatus Tokpelaia sp. TaxID=2233777 RepID=UPI001289C685|nr:hypothetical protein [Candidatus Tokpelaia sp.]KAA6406247.1 hypothetical protein DPQ22_00595 [Candidatus Tokpelaia sp.]